MRRFPERAAAGALGAWWLLLAQDPDAVDPRRLPVIGVWAIAAMVLPWAVRGRYLVFDVIAATMWAAGLASATVTVSEALDLAQPRLLVVGSVVAGLIAVMSPRYSDE